MTIIGLLEMRPTPFPRSSGGAGGGGGGAGLVDLFGSSGDGGGEVSFSDGTLKDVGVSVTVTDTAVNDVLYISAVVPAYNSSGTNSNFGTTFLVDGANANVDEIHYHGLRGGNVRVMSVKWRYTVQAGDITAGNTIVKLQCRLATGSGSTVAVVNGTDAVSTLNVMKVRA